MTHADKSRLKKLAMWRDGWAQGFEAGRRHGAKQMRRRCWRAYRELLPGFKIFRSWLRVRGEKP